MSVRRPPFAAARRRVAAALLAAGPAFGGAVACAQEFEPFAPAASAGERFGGGASGAELFDGGVRATVTRSARFALPVGDLGDRGGLAAVRLFRSSDAGASWTPAGTFPPDAARAPQQAPRDGEYWFAVRGLDRRGRSVPPGPLTPRFRVTVDSTPPRLALRGWWADENRLRVVVRAEDGGLVRDAVRLRYLPADPTAGWVDLTPAPGEADSWEGLVKMDLTRTVESPFDLTVRAVAADAAGNEATATLPLPRPRTATENAAGADDAAPPLLFGGAADPARPAVPLPLSNPAPPAPTAAPPSAAGGFPVAAFRPGGGSGYPVARFTLPGNEPGGAVAADWFVDLPAEVAPASAEEPPDGPLFSADAGEVNRLYERLLAAAPDDRALRLAYADRLTAAGDRAAAAGHLRTLLRRDPADGEALRRLTGLLPAVRGAAAPPRGDRR